MKEYRILIWFPSKYDYYDGLFKALNMRVDVECKDKSDFGFDVNYYSQKDYDKIQIIFQANIILLYQITKNEFCIDISDDVIVWSYIDDIFGKFVMIGKDYFKSFPKKNYLYLPLLDIDAFDIEGVMKSEQIQNKVITAPFVPLQNRIKKELINSEMDRFSSDIVLILYKKRIGDTTIRRMAGINDDNAYGKDVMLLLGLLYRALNKEIIAQGNIIIDIEWIERLLIRHFDELHIWQYSRNRDVLLERWKRIVLYIINVNLYGDIIADWIIEGKYNFKLYGGWTEKKYSKYSMGYLQDGSEEMYYVNHMAKIGINSNPFVTIHRRTLDCMSGGTMCMSAASATKDFDARHNFSHYSHFFDDKKSIVMFHNKEELISNIDYYLMHDKEREKIAQLGEKTILEKKLNYKDVVNNAFSEFVSRMEENGDAVI